MTRTLIIALLVFLTGCATSTKTVVEQPSGQPQDAARLLVIDCMLPGQIRKLGQNLTYLTPRRPIKATASDCEIRGGEYVSYDRANYATALKIWLPQAQEGDPDAQTYVGEIYEKGLGIQADYALAAQWYQKAAEQGHSRAQINLGYLHEGGLGVPQDLTVAMNWYRKASGLTGDDGELEYVSTLESAKREAVQQQAVALKEEVGTLQGQLAAAKNELDKRKSDLAVSKQEAKALKDELQVKKQALAERSSQPQSSQPQNLDETTRLSLEQQLKDVQNDQQRLIAKLAKQQLEASNLAQEKSALDEELKQRRQDLNVARTSLAVTQTELNRRQQENASSASNAEEVGKLEAKVQNLENVIKDQSLNLGLMEENKSNQELVLAEKLKTSQTTEQQLNKDLGLRNSEVASLQLQLSERDEVVNSLKQQLADTQAEQQQLKQQLVNNQTAENEANQSKQNLQEMQLALNTRNQEVASLQAQLTNANQQLTGKGKQAAEQVSQLEQELQRREQEIGAQQKSISELQSKLAQNTQPVEKSEFAAVINARSVGPTIEIIEPPLSVTRGTPGITLRSAVQALDIIGRVTPPNNLLSFQVNNRPQEVDNSGLFKFSMPVAKPDTPVSVVAVDQSGSRSAMDFVILPKGLQQKKTAPAKTQKPGKSSPVEFGRYHALIIGNDKYAHLPNLSTAGNDAQVVENILKTKYGFKTKLILNADRYAMLSALNEYREKLTEEDNLLIYYAGHGELDSVNLRGYWLPVDSELESSANWISNVSITDILNVMSAKHVLVVADSCYSGSLTRASIARLQGGMSEKSRTKWYKAMTKAKTRVVLTSGGVEPVLDAGGGNHSVFAKAFIDVLNENKGILEGFRLYREVQKRVKQVVATLNVKQDPQYAPIKYAGHEAGEFFFKPTALAKKDAIQPVLAMTSALH